MWWYHSTKTANIFWVTLDVAMHKQLMDAPCVAHLGLPKKIFAVLVEWYHHNVLTMSFKLVSFFTYISCIGRVIADFVPNFVAMAMGVGRSRICLASFNSPTPKTPCYTQRSRGYLLCRPSYSRFCAKFHCHGNGCHPRTGGKFKWCN